ncbi:MAG: helix-turn-helix domain-containing protein, partial [Bacillota bacterium]
MATAKKNVEFTSIDQAPAMMTVRQWCELNGVNENKGYEWAAKNDTPTIKLGQRIIIPKKAYIKWLEQEIE